MAALKPALLLLPATPADVATVVDLVLTDADYRHAVRLTDLADRLGQRAVVVVVPAEHSVISRVAIPAGHARQAARALPWAVEDVLLETPEHYQVGLGPADAGAWLVGWVAHTWLAAWVERLQNVGARPKAWMPEAALLPAAGPDWVLAGRGKVWLLQTGPGSVITVAESALPATLAQVAQDDSARPRLRVYAGAEARARLQAILEPASWSLTGDPPADLAALARRAWANEDHTWWLALPGRGESDAEGQMRWRVLRRLAAGLAAYGLALAALQGQDAEGVRALAVRRTQAEALVQEALPAIRRVVQPRAQLQQGLAELKRSTGLQGALAALGPQFQKAAGVRLQTLEYTPEVLRLQLRADDLLTLDHFTGVLDQELPGYRARMESAGPEGTEVSATVRLELQPP